MRVKPFPDEDVTGALERAPNWMIVQNQALVYSIKRKLGRTTYMTTNRLEAAADRSEILEVSLRSFVYRDRGNWDELLDSFHPDAEILTSWFEGNAHEFIEGSSKMIHSHDPADSQKHVIGNQFVSLNDDRAICEFYVTLNQRRRIDGYLFDFMTWSNVIDMHLRRDGQWRIIGRFTIYEKDRMDPHKRGEVPDSFFENMDLAPFPDALKFHCWRNVQGSGEPPSKGLAIENTERAASIRKDVRTWLDGGSLPWQK